MGPAYVVAHQPRLPLPLGLSESTSPALIKYLNIKVLQAFHGIAFNVAR